MNQFLYKNKKIGIVSSTLIILSGIVLAWLKYNSEPWETLGGFLCGFGLILFLVFISLKKPLD